MVFFWLYFCCSIVAIKQSANGFRSHFKNTFGFGATFPVAKQRFISTAPEVPALSAVNSARQKFVWRRSLLMKNANYCLLESTLGGGKHESK